MPKYAGQLERLTKSYVKETPVITQQAEMELFKKRALYKENFRANNPDY